MSSLLIPGNVPQLHSATVRTLLGKALEADEHCDHRLIRALCPVMVLAIRGYYRDTMGAAGRNVTGIFDDAAFIVAGDKVLRYNWNTDPVKVGWNPGVTKNFAMLRPGIWPFVRGQHKRSGAAWRQPDSMEANSRRLEDCFFDERQEGHFQVWRAATMAKVIADTAPSEWGYQAINIHWGGEHGTSSWGCQTAPPAQWKEFQRQSYALTKNQPWLPYVLINGASVD